MEEQRVGEDRRKADAGRDPDCRGAGVTPRRLNDARVSAREQLMADMSADRRRRMMRGLRSR